MLQDMQKTVESEGKKEEDLVDQIMCHCFAGDDVLEAPISWMISFAYICVTVTAGVTLLQ